MIVLGIVTCSIYLYYWLYVTADALDGTPAKGKIVELQGDTKAKVVASATNGSTVIGTIIDVNVVGRYTYYAIEVA